MVQSMVQSLAVIGNCQIASICSALRFFAPRIKVNLLTVTEVKERFKNIDELADAMRDHDYVFCQEFSEGIVPGGDSSVLAAKLPGLFRFPSIVFPAFHPDIVYVQLKEDNGTLSLLKSPLGDYHSSLILYGFILGFTPSQTQQLFCEDVLRRIGFLDMWLPAQTKVLASAHNLSMSLDKEFMTWARRGCFMHSLNHPRSFVLSDLARALLQRAKLSFRDVDPDPFLIDDLMSSIIWPVYPPVARALGCPGSYVFKKQMEQTFYDLDELIVESFGIYSQVAKKQLTCWRIDQWESNPEIGEFMRKRVTA